MDDSSSADILSFFQTSVTPIHSTPGTLGNEKIIVTDYSVAQFDDLKNNVKNANGAPTSVEITVGGKRVLKGTSGETADILLAHLPSGTDRIVNFWVVSNPLLLDQILSTFEFTN